MLPAKPGRKPVEFVGESLRALRSFPESAKRKAGYQLALLQDGNEPSDWKPMAAVGSGACELRIRDESGAYRVVYVAKFKAAIYVLHCFEKRTQKTPLNDIAIAKNRYKQIVKENSA